MCRLKLFKYCFFNKIMKKELIIIFLFVLILVYPVIISCSETKIQVSVQVVEPEKNLSVNQQEIGSTSNTGGSGELMSVKIKNNFFLIGILTVLLLTIIFLIATFKGKKKPERVKVVNILGKTKILGKKKSKKKIRVKKRYK